MAPKRHVSAPKPIATGRIRPNNKPCSGCPYESDTPLFRFSTEICVYEWFHDMPGDAQKAAIDKIKLMERMRWPDVLRHNGIRYKRATRSSLKHDVPESVPPDCDLDYFRFGLAERVFGYRVENVFHICWFDRAHQSMVG